MALPLAYHWRHLFARKTTTLITVVVVAAVIATFSWMLSFTLALDASLSVAGDREKLVVLRPGSDSESQSALAIPDFNKLSQLADVARNEDTHEVLISPETMVQVGLPRKNDDGRSAANVAVRGVLDVAFQVHRKVRIVEGRKFATGAREVIVGLSAARQYAGLEIGQSIDLGFGGNRNYAIVGYFSADGGPLESEIWGYLPSLLDAYGRNAYSSANLRLSPGAKPQKVIGQIQGPAIQLAARTEADYWAAQTTRISKYLGVAYALVTFMFLAAVISVAITMFSAVAGRTREIGMLRTLGFSRTHILGGFVLESLLLCVIGAGLGCLACAVWLAVVGGTKDMFGASTFTTLAFNIRLTPFTVLGALAVVAVVGTIGAFFPAWRASRVEIVAVLRGV